MTTIYAGDYQDYKQQYCRESAVWVVSRYKFTATPTVNDVVVFFIKNHYGWYVADWWVSCEQVDTNESPTVTFNIGYLNSGSTAVDTTSGYCWVTGTTALGRAASPNTSLLRAPDAMCQAFNVGRHIGVEATNVGATAAWTNKWMYFGALWVPL